MTAIYKAIDALNERVGRFVSWFVLAMVLIQFLVVLLRYVFATNEFAGINTVMWQEMIVYLHGALFMLAAGYTLLHNGHVRVDVFYASASQRARDWTDLLGSLFFILPVCALIVWASWPVVEGSWARAEASTEPIGIPYRYVLRLTLIVMPVLLALQAISTAIKSALRLMGHEVDDPYYGEESLD